MIGSNRELVEAHKARVEAKIAREKTEYFDKVIDDIIVSLQDLTRLDAYFLSEKEGNRNAI